MQNQPKNDTGKSYSISRSYPKGPQRTNNLESSSSSSSGSSTSIHEPRPQSHFPKSYRINGQESGQTNVIQRTTSTGDETQILNTLDNLPPNQTPRLSFIQKVLISSGHVMNDLCASLWFTYGLIYLKKVAEGGTGGRKGDSYAAIALTVGQFVDGIATPIVGYEADHFKRCCLCDRNYGRFKSWHLIGSILVMLSFPFIYSPCIGCTDDTSNLAKFFYYTSFIAVFQIGWATVQVSHLALIPKMHPDDLIRTELFSKRYGFTVIANIIIFIMTWFTLGNHADCKISENDGLRFMMIGLLAIGIGSIFTLCFQIFVKENPDSELKSHVSTVNAKKQLIRRLSSSPGFYDPDQLAGGGIPTDPTTTIRKRRQRTRSNSYGSITSVGSRISRGSQSKAIVQIHRSPNDELLNQNATRGRTISGQDSVQDLDSILDESLRIESHPQLSTVAMNPGRHKMRIRDWFRMPQFYLGAFVYMCTRLSVNLGQVYMPLYVQDFLKLPCNTVATVPLVMYISGFLVSMVVKFLNKLLGRQIAYTVGACLTLLAACLILLLDWENEINKKYIIYVVGVFLGGGSSAILVTSLSITADIIGTNIESGAFVYGVFSFTDKVSCGLAIMLIDQFLPCDFGDNSDATTQCLESNGKYYQEILGYATGGSALFGIFGVLVITILIHIRNRKLEIGLLDDEDEGDVAQAPNCIQEEDPSEEQIEQSYEDSGDNKGLIQRT